MASGQRLTPIITFVPSTPGVRTMDPGVAAAAAAHAAMVQATKASGVLVRVDAAAFLTLVDLNPEPVVVRAPHNVFFGRKRIRYMTSYRGLAFVTESRIELEVPVHADLIEAGKMWLPS